MLAQTQGMDVNKYMSDFNAQATNLAKFGLPDVTSEFNRLAIIQEKTGASMDSLMGAMDTFSTFEGALNAASKLNAAFDTTIDGMEIMDTMMQKGPAESLLLLRERLEETGQSFDTMNYAQKRAMQQALGMDMKTLNQFMSKPFTDLEAAVAASDGSIESLGDSMNSLQKDSKDMMTQEERVAKAQDLQREAIQGLADAMYDLRAGITELMGGFGGMITSLAAGFLGTGSVMFKAIGAVGQFASRLGSAGTNVGSLTNQMGELQNVTPQVSDTISKSSQGLGRMSKMAGIAAKAMGALAVAMVGLYLTEQLVESLGGKGEKGTTAGNAANILGKGATGAAAGAMVAGPAGAIVGGIGGLAWGAIEAQLPSGHPSVSGGMYKLGDRNGPEMVGINGQNFMTGMGGPQSMYLPPGASVTPVQAAGNTGQSMGPQEIVVNMSMIDDEGKLIGNKQFKKRVSDQMNEELAFNF